MNRPSWRAAQVVHCTRRQPRQHACEQGIKSGLPSTHQAPWLSVSRAHLGKEHWSLILNSSHSHSSVCPGQAVALEVEVLE